MAQRWQDSRTGVDSDPRRRFFCDLCQKGYARQIDLDHHENDYDHQHRKREKDRKELSRDANAEAKAKAAERRANQQSGMKTISVNGKLKNETRKPPRFKPIGQAHSDAQRVMQTPGSLMVEHKLDLPTTTIDNDPSGAIRNGWYEDQYDPMIITNCMDNCPACHGKDEAICL